MPAPRPTAEPAWAGPGSRAAWALWALAVLLLLLWRLGASPLFDVDEGAFSEATREMLASRDWLHTTLNGADRFDKPILVYWLQAASMAAFGPTKFAARLPSALCAWAWVLASAHFARPRFGAGAAFAGATLLATSVGVLAIGRAATADALLNLLLALTLFDLWRHLQAGRRAPLLRAALWAALGVMAKGPIALLVPAATLGLWAGLQAAQRRPWRRAMALALDPLAWLVLVGVAAPWYAYALQRHGQAFVDGFFLKHNVGRFASTLEGHAGGPLYYAVALPLLLLPWSPLLPALLPRLRALWQDPLAAWLLLWAVFVLVFFSLSGTKLPHYVLYGATPLALLCGQRLAGPLARGWRLGLAAGLGLTVVTLATAPWALIDQAGRIRNPLYRALLAGAPPPDWTWAAALALLAVAALQWPRRAAPADDAHAARSLGSAAIVAALVTGGATPWVGEALQGPVHRAALAARSAVQAEPALRVVTAGLEPPSFAFALGQPVPRRTPQPGDLVLVRLDRLPPGSHAVVFSERGIALVRWRGGPSP